jgi:hypothetical protein
MDYFTTLNRWHAVKQAIRDLQKEEQTLRTGLFGGTFTAPREGVNNFTLPDGSILKGTYELNRNLVKDFQQKLPALKLPQEIVDKLIVTKYSLSVKEYKALEPEVRKKVDSILDIKPAMPKLELVPPKE